MLTALAELNLRQGRQQVRGPEAGSENSSSQLRPRWAQAIPETALSAQEYISLYKKWQIHFTGLQCSSCVASLCEELLIEETSPK